MTLVAGYRFDGNLSAVNNGGPNLDFSAPQTFGPGVHGQANVTLGSQAYRVFTFPDALGFTLAGWVNVAADGTVGSDIPLFGVWDTTNQSGSSHMALYHRRDSFGPTNRLTLSIRTGGTLKAVAPPTEYRIPVGEYHHVAATYDGANARIFVDAVEVASGVVTGAINTSPLYMVKEGFAAVDDMQILDEAYSAAGIASLMAVQAGDLFDPDESSVFGTTVPAGNFTVHADGGGRSVLAHQFTNMSGQDLQVRRLRWNVPYVPSATGLLGSPRSGFIGLQFTDPALSPPYSNVGAPDEMPVNGTWTPFTNKVISPGWNEFTYATPWNFPAGWSVLVGINIEGWYVYDNDEVYTGDIIALDGSGLWLRQMGTAPAQPHRTFYDSDYASVHSFTGTTARWYGIDLVVTEDVTPDIPVGGFESAYGWGAAVAGGTIETRGGFASIGYGWGPATASGVTGADGVFEGVYGWGPALFTSRATVRGGFQGAITWGAAEFGGIIETQGAFVGTYHWGRAVFGGAGGNIPRFPVCDFDLVGTGPTLSLTGEGPSLGLEGSCSS